MEEFLSGPHQLTRALPDDRVIGAIDDDISPVIISPGTSSSGGPDPRSVKESTNRDR